MLNFNYDTMLLLTLLCFSLTTVCGTLKMDFLGCYENNHSATSLKSNRSLEILDCITFCKDNHYRYASRNDFNCICENVLGKEINNTIPCGEYCPGDCEEKSFLVNVYLTGNEGLGPPRNVSVTNITDTSARLTWREPASDINITYYKIKANILNSYSNFTLSSPEWTFYEIFQADLISLQPATKYNLTVQAVHDQTVGPPAFHVFQTLLGEPDNKPEPPEIVSKTDTTATIQLFPVVNNNGPVSAYQVIVVYEDAIQAFTKDNLRDFQGARQIGINYYITAELSPERLGQTFTVGDGHHYKTYYNAPLQKDKDYRIIAALVSRLDGLTEMTFSELSNSQRGVLVLDVDDEADGSRTVAVLTAAIVVLSFLFVAGLIGFVVLKKRINRHRQRLTSNTQELSIQGPVIEIENSGFIPDEELQPVNYYKTLKQKVKTIPFSSLKVDWDVVKGYGRFGSVYDGSLQEEELTVYSIADRKLEKEEKRKMLKDLDLLIQSEKHYNVITFLGTSETSGFVSILLEHINVDLKTLLIDSRTLLDHGCITKLTSDRIGNILQGILKGMMHLSKNKIIHKQLCARNIYIVNDFVAKIGGFGLSHISKINKTPNYTRWTALEVFRGFPHTMKSDVWSFACLFWEICALGATPYCNVEKSKEVERQVLRGLRLPELPRFSTDIYQLMLNCWQLDTDERPTFEQLYEELQIDGINNFVDFQLGAENGYMVYREELEFDIELEFSIQ